MSGRGGARRSKIFILGAYGCGNKGDDAILQAICAQFPDCEIVSTTGNKLDVSSELPVKTVSCRLNEGFSARLLLSMAADSVSMLREIRRCDAFFFGGGSLIHDCSFYNLPFMFLWHGLARLLGKPVYYVCIGIGPVDSRRGKRLCAKWLRLADGVYPRDERGRRICDALGVPCRRVCDAAFTFREKYVGKVSLLRRFSLTEGEYIVVTASEWMGNRNYFQDGASSESVRDTEARFTAALKAVSEQLPYPMVFLPSEARDIRVGTALEKALGGRMRCLPIGLTCNETEGIAENCRMMIGMRMHPMIFALRHYTPALAIVYDEKVLEMMSLMGLSEYALSLDNLERLPEKACDIEENRCAISRRIAQRVRIESADTEKVFADIRRAILSGTGNSQKGE